MFKNYYFFFSFLAPDYYEIFNFEYSLVYQIDMTSEPCVLLTSNLDQMFSVGRAFCEWKIKVVSLRF